MFQHKMLFCPREGEKKLGSQWSPSGVLEGPPPPVILPPGESASLAFLSSGIPTVPGKVTLQKDAQNLIGISIGGGAQYCPCLYIVQVLGALEGGTKYIPTWA